MNDDPVWQAFAEMKEQQEQELLSLGAELRALVASLIELRKARETKE